MGLIHLISTFYRSHIIHFYHTQTEAANEAGAIAVIMMRRESDANSLIPPTTRIYKQDGDEFRVAPLPVMGATYLLGEQLQDFLDLTNTVSTCV